MTCCSSRKTAASRWNPSTTGTASPTTSPRRKGKASSSRRHNGIWKPPGATVRISPTISSKRILSFPHQPPRRCWSTTTTPAFWSMAAHRTRQSALRSCTRWISSCGRARSTSRTSRASRFRILRTALCWSSTAFRLRLPMRTRQKKPLPTPLYTVP